MNNKQRKALILLLGEDASEVIEAWCNVSQPDGVIDWIRGMLLEEIHECWGEDSDYPKLDLRDKLTLDRFFEMGSFREQTVTAGPKICPDCQGQLFPGDQLDCPITGERHQQFECGSCNFSMSIALSDLETYPECY